MDYQTAINLQGYLEKQSPNILATFQRRYFTLRFNGQYLVWFKKKPSQVADEPKGFIKLVDILSINPVDYDDNYFEIQYPERTFVLRAQTKQMRDRWVDSLEVIVKHHNHLLKQGQNKGDSKMNGWRWNKANYEEMNLIRKENQKQLMNEGEDSIHESSKKFFFELMGVQFDEDFNKNAIFGYFNRKGHIKTETRWYFLCSQYNLYENNDEEPQQLTNFIQTIEESINTLNSTIKKKSVSDSSSDSQNDIEILKNRIEFKINHLYEFDIITKKLIQILPLVQILDWAELMTQNPWSLKIRYLIFNKGEQQDKLSFKQHEKDILLMSNYQTQISKWSNAIKICFKRYSLAMERQKMLDDRFVRFQIKMFRQTKHDEWRVIGTEEKPEYLYLNREHIKIGGITLNLENIDINQHIIKQKVKLKESDKIQQASTTMTMSKELFTVAFYTSEEEKSFRKKIKVFLKKLEPYMKERQAKKLKVEAQESNMNTYYIDKKMRETTNNIKINFYEVLEQQNPNQTVMSDLPTKKKRLDPQSSFMDRFLSIFCGPTIDDIEDQIQNR